MSEIVEDILAKQDLRCINENRFDSMLRRCIDIGTQ